TPVPRFPAISISGTQCDLHCKHCNASYLGGMLAATTPEQLLKLSHNLVQKGAVGMLLSGGSDSRGCILNLDAMTSAINQVKSQTDLIINVHPGLASDYIASNLKVDFASLEIAADATIKEVFGLPFMYSDYIDAYHRLIEGGNTVVPHVSVYDGTEHHLLAGMTAPETIVVIVFSPTRNTPMAHYPSPTPIMVENVIRHIKEMYPETEISLGCMRARDRKIRHEIEMAALQGGATRMELPMRKTLQHVHAMGFTDVINFDACCALPTALEPRALSRRKDHRQDADQLRV
ncbi:MAG: hypothetical protein P1S60_13305, partial [Anaerolineae bacterium]|nr:hypothetical protein [Anaerolineae bacterium]